MVENELLEIKYFNLLGKFLTVDLYNFKIEGDHNCSRITGEEYSTSRGLYIPAAFWAKKINNEWWLHHDELPAVVYINGGVDDRHAFFQNGTNVQVDQLNCDPSIKVMYTLKYDYSEVNNFHLYYGGS